MKTSHIPNLLPKHKFKLDSLADGSERLLASDESLRVEIIPEKSVSFFVTEVTAELFLIIDSYIKNKEKTIDCLQRFAASVVSNPNAQFRENIGGDLYLIASKIVPKYGGTLHLSILEE